MPLSKLEEDLLGDLALDPHHVGEILGFVRLHHPDASPEEIRRLARELISSWISRGWLQVVSEGSQPPPVTLDQVPEALDASSSEGDLWQRPLIWLWVTDRARQEVPWIG